MKTSYDFSKIHYFEYRSAFRTSQNSEQDLLIPPPSIKYVAPIFAIQLPSPIPPYSCPDQGTNAVRTLDPLRVPRSHATLVVARSTCAPLIPLALQIFLSMHGITNFKLNIRFSKWFNKHIKDGWISNYEFLIWPKKFIVVFIYLF